MDAVRALPDVKSVAFDIPTETFTVDLAPEGKPDAVLAAIKQLGYEPTRLDAPPTEATSSDRIKPPTAASLTSALARARARGVPLVVDFGGEFCSACKAFEQNVLSDARVQKALEAFEFLRVDITVDTEAASDLGVTAVPDIWILSGDGGILGRENRTMNVDEFLGVLKKHAP